VVPKDVDHNTTELNTSDLELMHQWTLSSYTGFGYRSGEETMWRDEIPRIALKHPFLMRGLLAVSALQLARLLPAQKEHYLSVAAQHQNLALPSYRYLVGDISHRMTAENCHAIIAFGHLTTAYAFASPHPPGSVLFAGLCSSNGVPEWLYLLRGARRILSIAKDWIADSPSIFSLRGLPETIDVSLSPEDFQLAALGVEIDNLEATSPQEYHELDLCRESLFLLRQAFAIPHQPGELLGAKFAVFIWVEVVPSEFLKLLSSLKPVALVILAHLCVLLKKCENFWYIKGAAERIIFEVNNIIDESWRPWIAWALQVVQTEF
jgi:hypothetical protein